MQRTTISSSPTTATARRTGRAEFIEGTVDFAGTDVPVSDAEEAQLTAKGMGYLQFAYVGGGIVIAYNPGSGLPYNLKLSADTIGKIFSGQIVNWDDPELADENHGRLVAGPEASASPLDRTARALRTGFTSFMAQTSHVVDGRHARDVFDSPPLPAFPAWSPWQAASGVADAVRDNPGMIGYVELSFARERRLNVAAVEGADGFVLPDTSAVTEAIASLRPERATAQSRRASPPTRATRSRLSRTCWCVRTTPAVRPP